MTDRRTFLAGVGATIAAMSLSGVDAFAAPKRGKGQNKVGDKGFKGGGFKPKSWTDPFASAAPTAWGKEIGGLGMDAEGRLWVGHGDWNENIGPIDIHYLDPKTGVFSPSMGKLSTESTQYMRMIDGKVFIANSDPRGWGNGAAPYFIQEGETFVETAHSNVEHAYDIVKLPAQYGDQAFGVIGHYVKNVNGKYVSEYAVYLTFDGGKSFKVLERPSDVENTYSSAQECAVIGGKFYTSNASAGTYVWNGVIPTEEVSNWNDYMIHIDPGAPFENVWMTGCHGANAMVVHRMSSIQENKFDYSGYDGVNFYPLPSDIFMVPVKVDAVDGWCYIWDWQSLYRSMDGKTWFRHPTAQTPKVTLPKKTLNEQGYMISPTAKSACVGLDGILYLGYSNSTIHAVADTNVTGWIQVS